MLLIEANVAVSVSELKKSPSTVMEMAHGQTVAVLKHNWIMAYMVPAKVYEEMLEN
jgi:antitoxin StbD